MYKPKIPKSEKPDTTAYTIHHCHTIVNEPIDWYSGRDHHRILSIDPGKRNFCFRIELRDYTKGIIKMEAYEKIDLLGESVDGKVKIDYIYRNSMLILKQYEKLIVNCHVVLIERQLAINYKMVRFSQHVISNLMSMLYNNDLRTVIMEIDSTVKTQQFGIKGLGKRETKKWAIEKADQLLRARGDQASLNIIKKAKSKKDDLSDTVVQIEAVWKHFKLPVTEHFYGHIVPVPDKIPYAQNQLYYPSNSLGATIGQIRPEIPVDVNTYDIRAQPMTIDWSTLNLNNYDIRSNNISNQQVHVDLNKLDLSNLKNIIL